MHKYSSEERLLLQVPLHAKELDMFVAVEDLEAHHPADLHAKELDMLVAGEREREREQKVNRERERANDG